MFDTIFTLLITFVGVCVALAAKLALDELRWLRRTRATDFSGGPPLPEGLRCPPPPPRRTEVSRDDD